MTKTPTVVTFDDELPPKEKSNWEKFNAPIADLRHDNPTMAAATDKMQQDYPWIGGPINAVLDTMSGMTSPAMLGLSAVTAGGGVLSKVASKLGLEAAIPVAKLAMKAGGAGMLGHGGYKVVAGETPYDKVGGAIEATLGGLGLAAGGHGSTTSKEPVNPYKSPKGLRVAFDALKDRGNLVGPTTKGGNIYSDELDMHKALDEHTLRQRRGPLAIEISGKEGRPEVGVKDPQGKLSLASRGLSIVDAQKAYNEGLDLAGKDARNSNALEKAKGAPSKIEQSELTRTKPILDLIEASKTRELNPAEFKQLMDETGTYPKGVVAKALETYKKTSAQASRAEDVAATQTQKGWEGVAKQENARDKYVTTQQAQEARNLNARTRFLKDQQGQEARNLNARDKFTRGVEVARDNADLENTKRDNATAQQKATDDFIARSDVKAGPESMTQSQSGIGANGEKRNLRQSFHEVPPDPENGGGGDGTPEMDGGPSPISDRLFGSYKAAKQAANRARSGDPNYPDVNIVRTSSGKYKHVPFEDASIPVESKGGALPADLNTESNGLGPAEPALGNRVGTPPLDFPEGVFEPQPTLKSSKASYDRIKAAKDAGLVIPEGVRKAAGEELQGLEKGAAPIRGAKTSSIKAKPIQPVEPEIAPDPTKDSAIQEIQTQLDDPSVSPVEKQLYQRILDKLKASGIELFPGDKPGGTTTSMFGAGQGGSLQSAFKNTFGGTSEDAGEALLNGARNIYDPLQKAGSFLNNFRRASLLNSYSVAKKGLGDVQGFALASMENPGRAPELWRQIFNPETVNEFKSGYDAPAPGSEDADLNSVFYSKANPLGVSGRTMSGFTNAAKGAYGRAGFTPEEAGAYTLTKTPSRAVTAGLYDLMNRPVMNHLNPFSRIALNWIEQGYEHSPLGLTDLLTKRNELSGAEAANIMKKAAIGTGATAASYALTPDDFVKEHPVASRMMTAGPLGAPILAGMLLKNQSKSPISESAYKVMEELPGMRLPEDLKDLPNFARNYVASYTNATKPIAEWLDPEQKDVSSEDLGPFENLFNRAQANTPILRSSLPNKPEKKHTMTKVVF